MELLDHSKITKFIPRFIESRQLSADESEKLNCYIKSIKIYGTSFKPLYHYRDSVKLFKVKDADKIEFDDPEEKFLGKVLDKNGDIKKKKLLTTGGLYRLIYSSNTNIGRLFRRCITFIFNQLLLEQCVTNKDIIKHVEEHHAQLAADAIRDLHNTIEILHKEKEEKSRTIKVLEKNLDKVQNKCEYLEDEMFAEKARNYALVKKCDSLEHEKSNFERVLLDDSQYENVPETRRILQAHSNKIYIYLEEPIDKVDEYNVNDYSEDNPPYDVMGVYSVSKKKLIGKRRVLVKMILDLGDNYDEIISDLKETDYVRFIGKTKFACTYEDIMLICGEDE